MDAIAATRCGGGGGGLSADSGRNSSTSSSSPSDNNRLNNKKTARTVQDVYKKITTLNTTGEPVVSSYFIASLSTYRCTCSSALRIFFSSRWISFFKRKNHIFLLGCYKSYIGLIEQPKR